MEDESSLALRYPNSGIYFILVARGLLPTKLYVGKSANLKKRKVNHFNGLRAGKHQNKLMQRCWEKYGEAAFEFRVIKHGAPDGLVAMEQQALDSLRLAQGDDHLLNIMKDCVETRLGVRHTAEVRQTLSQRQAANWQKADYRAALTAALKITRNLPEVRARNSTAQKASQNRPELKLAKSLFATAQGLDQITKEKRRHTNQRPEVIERRRISAIRAKADPAVKAKARITQKIVQNDPKLKAKIAAINALPETKQKRSLWSKTYQATPEARERQRQAQLVAQNRPETKIKKSASCRLAFARPEVKENRRISEARPEVKAKRLAVGRANAERFRLLRETAATQKRKSCS